MRKHSTKVNFIFIFVVGSSRVRVPASRVSYEGTSKTHYRTEYVALYIMRVAISHAYVSAYLWSTIERRRTSRSHSGCAKRTG
jgi:hypothetical protein